MKLSSQAYASTPFAHVLDSFEIDQQTCLVILLEDHSQPFSVTDLPDHPLNHCKEISRFKVGSHFCAIIKIQQDHPKASDLTLLLTDRELQIATLVALGQPNKQIARQLHISEWTVSTHLRRIFIKLGVDSRAAMVYRCAGLIQKLQGHFSPS